VAESDTPTNRERCGRPKRQGDRSPCKQPAGWGTNHVGSGPCKKHGGSISGVAKHHQAILIEAKVRTLFGQTEDTRPVDNPLAMYADFAGKVMAWMAVLDKLCHDIDSPRYAGLTGEQIRGEVQLYERAMDRCNTVLSTYAKLNIDERLARITEAQQLMVLQAIEAALAAAEVTGARAVDAKKAAAKRLRVAA
jgi:hypothetical protein